MDNIYTKSIADAMKKVNSCRDGLSKKDAERRLLKYGKNELPKERSKFIFLKILLRQFSNPLVFILLVAAVVSALLREWIDMSVIFLTVCVNASVGFVQEFKANTALKKLGTMIQYHAIVLRDNHEYRIDGEGIVVGDIMVLNAGDKIQADGRIIESKQFFVNEAVLTGESQAQQKKAGKLSGEKSIADRTNMVYRGTTVNNGRAVVLVTAIAVDTEIGRIASLVRQTNEEETPLQKQLKHVATWLGIIVLAISIIIFLLGFFVQSGHYTIFELFETAVALAVAAIPEGLVISMTVILAIGMQHMLRRRALVRRLLAAETLGSVNVICTDKTGTLTQGNMSVVAVHSAQEELNAKELRALGRDTYKKHEGIVNALRIAIIASDVVVDNNIIIGDTTDVAFVNLGVDIELEKEHLDFQYRRVDSIPFNSEYKYNAVLCENDTRNLYVKGAPEIILAHATHYYHQGVKKKLTHKQRAYFFNIQKGMSERGLRVIAVAYKGIKEDQTNIEHNDIHSLVFVALIALEDPLRDDVKDVLSMTREAGIRTIMITGDHESTAHAIAIDLGLVDKNAKVFNGNDLENISDEELIVLLDTVSVFARVDPKHKIRIVQALQRRGDVVAMTGDGVNDAPAIKAADIGIAVGSGTDVAKEIADVVLLDDDFKTIISAIEEGRGMYHNIKKILLYLMAGSFAEVFLIVGSIVLCLPLPVLPVQILWVNLIQDSLPNMALAFDRSSHDVMKEKPRSRDTSLFDTDMKIMITLFTIVINIVLFAIFMYYMNTFNDVVLARTVTFAGLAIGCLLYIYSVRFTDRPLWKSPVFNNPFLNIAVLIGWLLLIAAIYLPPLQILLRTVSLGLRDWTILILFAILNIIIVELLKSIIMRKKI